jgi:hypothetical protein
VANAAAEGRVGLHALPAEDARVVTVLVRRRDAFLSMALSRFIDTARTLLPQGAKPAPRRNRR